MAAPKKFPADLKERATRLTMAARNDPATRAGAFKRARDQVGAPPTRSTWVRDAEVAGKIRPGVPGAEAARIAELEREFRELRRGTLS